MAEVACCPEIKDDKVCESMNFRYVVPFQNEDKVKVEVVLHYEFQRCAGAIVMGEPIYSTTLMPGEKVQLFTSDRHSRWSYDSESNLAYHNETTSEESFFSAGFSKAISDLTINEEGVSESSYEESWSEGGGGASLNLGFIKIGNGSGGGSYDVHSLKEFAHSLSRHAKTAAGYVASAVRAKSATTIGEVAKQKHAKGESESSFEATSRTFSNPNKCNTVTYLFHKLNKLQTIKFKLVAIERRVEDPAAPTGANQTYRVDTRGQLRVIPKGISATNKDRLGVEERARASAANQINSNPELPETPSDLKPISIELRKKVLKQVDQDLQTAHLIDAEGNPTKKIVAQLSWEKTEYLPTSGVVIKGCLDECNTCEPTLKKEIELELARKALKNDLLLKQIALLELSQEYRCCHYDSSDSD
jgi:hypothetical protein